MPTTATTLALAPLQTGVETPCRAEPERWTDVGTLARFGYARERCLTRCPLLEACERYADSVDEGWYGVVIAGRLVGSLQEPQHFREGRYTFNKKPTRGGGGGLAVVREPTLVPGRLAGRVFCLNESRHAEPRRMVRNGRMVEGREQFRCDVCKKYVQGIEALLPDGDLPERIYVRPHQGGKGSRSLDSLRARVTWE